ncbi:MAG: DASH family cryptochrome [Breznakibacter sp.]
MQPIIYWFRNDLRLHDNPALAAAVQSQRPVLFVYVFEEKWITGQYLGFRRCGANRLAFWEASVLAMRRQLRQMGGELHIFRGNSQDIIHTIAKKVNALAVYAQHEFAHEETELERLLAAQVNLQLFWGNMLFIPGTIALEVEKSPFYFSAFHRKVLSLKPHIGQTVTSTDIHFHRTTIDIESYEPLSQAVLVHKAGEEEALSLLHNYLHSGHLIDYHLTRELFEGNGFSTLWSPYLSMGSLSVQRAFHQLEAVSDTNRALAPSVEKLKSQLIWRDYYRWLFLRYGKRIFRRTGLRTVTPLMHDDHDAFEAWRLGQTGNALVDALMRELMQTGFISNRGRMIASYYLSKEMKTNWLWGANWFESQLIDYDVCNNYGNWAYQSGTGTDSRINRRFNVVKQAEKFDPKGLYRNRWADRQEGLP